MDSESDPNWLKYDYYQESEWRVIWSERVRDYLRGKLNRDYSPFFVEPSGYSPEFVAYLDGQSATPPSYLMPIREPNEKSSDWLAVIVYPDIITKALAQADREIQELMQRLKPPAPTEWVQINTTASWERFSRPVEIDLSSCKNI